MISISPIYTRHPNGCREQTSKQGLSVIHIVRGTTTSVDAVLNQIDRAFPGDWYGTCVTRATHFPDGTSEVHVMRAAVHATR